MKASLKSVFNIPLHTYWALPSCTHYKLQPALSVDDFLNPASLLVTCLHQYHILKYSSFLPSYYKKTLPIFKNLANILPPQENDTTELIYIFYINTPLFINLPDGHVSLPRICLKLKEDRSSMFSFPNSKAPSLSVKGMGTVVKTILSKLRSFTSFKLVSSLQVSQAGILIS